MTNDTRPPVVPVGGDYTIMPTKLAETLTALVPLADAACDYADSHCRWFDISTAPKEIGVEFLASIEIGSTVSAWKEIHILCLDEEGIDSDHDQGWCLDDYSYWAPLPPPPSNPPLPAVFVELGQALEKIKEGR